MKASKAQWYTVRNIASVDSPALLVYPDRVLKNIRHALKMVPDKTGLRPHVKTNKMAEVCTMMLQEGITKFKCATIAEAEMLARVNAPDVLLAYQPVGPKAERFLELIDKYPQTRFSCLVDDEQVAAYLSKLALEAKKKVTVWIDLNVGMNRTGIVPEKAPALIDYCHQLEGIEVEGLHAYDGHNNAPDLAARKREGDAIFERVHALVLSTEKQFGKTLRIVLGGSPSFPAHLHRKNVECSPGTFVFWDAGYQNKYPEQPFDIAALVVTRVISIVDRHTICTDLGHKSVAAENPLPRVHFLHHPSATPVGQSEEHLLLGVNDASAYKIGDVLYGVPVHICPTVALYERAIVVEKKEASEEWKIIARDRKISV